MIMYIVTTGLFPRSRFTSVLLNFECLTLLLVDIASLPWWRWPWSVSCASSYVAHSDSHTQLSTPPYRDSSSSEYTSFSANVRYLNWFDEEPHILNIHTTVYLNSLLATLNSRQSLNNQRQNDPMFSLPLPTNARRCGEASQHNGSKSTIRGQVG